MKWAGGFLAAILLLLLVGYQWVSFRGSPYTHAAEASIPKHEFGVVLGTSRLLTGGGENAYFSKRIESAASLYNQGKIEKILLSGDFSTPYYNEPRDMKDALIEHGIPKTALYTDPLGIRTYHSIVRARSQYGVDSFIVISQDFHAVRAVFIARHLGISATGFVAGKPNKVFFLRKTFYREIIARMRSIWDCYFVPPGDIAGY